MKRMIAILLTAAMVLGTVLSAGAEDMWDVFRGRIEGHMETLTEKGMPDQNAECYMNMQKCTMGDGEEAIVVVGLLPNAGTNLRPWLIEHYSDSKTEVTIDGYKDLYFFSFELFNALNLSTWNTEREPIEGSAPALLPGYVSDKQSHDMCFMGILKDGVLVSDELYIFVRFYEEAGEGHHNTLALINDQQLVFDCVKALFEYEEYRAGLPNEVIEWFSRRPESGFLAPVVITESEE